MTDATPRAVAPKPAAGTRPDYSGSAEALNASLLWQARNQLRRLHGLWQIRRSRFQLDQLSPPVIVGATGGSGTRAIAQILQAAGINMGSRHNFAVDAMDFVPFVVRWTRSYCTTGARSRPMDEDFDIAVFRFRRGITHGEPWGAKAPRFIYFLPYLFSRMPEMKFIHVIRDGRDMALAPNQSQLHDYGSFLVDARLRGAPEAVRSMALWARVNTDAARFGLEMTPKRYLLVRLEDLCEKAPSEVERILQFIGSNAPHEKAISIVQKPETTGRWKSAPPGLIEQITQVGREALEQFGYR